MRGDTILIGVKFENWKEFVGYMAEQIEHDNFLGFFNVAGLCKEDVNPLWKNVDNCDWDNVELDEWQGFSLMFPNDEILEVVQHQNPLIEIFSCRLSINRKSIVFHMAGESIFGTEAFCCFSYGFIDETNIDNNFFVCLVE